MEISNSSWFALAETRGELETDKELRNFLRCTRQDLEEFVRYSQSEEFEDQESFAWFTDVVLTCLPPPSSPIEVILKKKTRKSRKRLAF